MKPVVGRKVLVLDDDDHALQTAAALLVRHGFVVATYSGMLNRITHAVNERPDLILVDVNMPLVPGDELVKLLAACPSLAGVPMVLFSSNDEGALRQAARACGAAGYICKSEMGRLGFAAKVARYLAPA